MKFSIVMPLHIRSDGIELILNEICIARKTLDFDLFFFVDGAKSAFETEKQSELLTILNNYDNESWINLIKREHNLGLKTNIESALDFVSNKYEAFQVIEDDCLVSASGITSIFLFLQNNEPGENQILAVNSISFNLKTLKYRWNYSDRLISWGWGTWSEIWLDYRVQALIFSRDELLNSIPDHWTLFEKFFVARMYKMINNLDSWAIPFSVYLRLNGYVASPSCNFTNLIANNFSTHAHWSPRLNEADIAILDPTISSVKDLRIRDLKILSWGRTSSLIYGYCIHSLRKIFNFFLRKKIQSKFKIK